MRRPWVVALLGAVMLVGGWLLWGAQGVPRTTPTVSKARTPVRTASRVQPANAGSTDPATTRNIFEFADPGGIPRVEAPPRARPSAVTTPPPAEDIAPPELEAPVRLVGVVLRAGKRKAALAIRGELAVLGPGESADGYTVLAIDEEDGVRLRGPDGETTLTSPGGSPGA
jgi:hypothetical protein